MSAECLFVNSIADIAVLGSPDNQSFLGQADPYHSLIDACHRLKIGDVAAYDTPKAARLVALASLCRECTVVGRGDAGQVRRTGAAGGHA